MIKSVFRNSVVDTIFIHAQKDVLNSSYLDDLMQDPLYNEKILVIDVDFNHRDDGTKQLTANQCTSAGVRAVNAFGGFYLKVQI